MRSPSTACHEPRSIRTSSQSTPACSTLVTLDDDVTVPVVQARDLVLLKLYAGGPQDAWDIQRLLAASESNDGLREEVEADVSVLPRRCIDLWKQLSHL
jgi:hypothetical protein